MGSYFINGTAKLYFQSGLKNLVFEDSKKFNIRNLANFSERSPQSRRSSGGEAGRAGSRSRCCSGLREIVGESHFAVSISDPDNFHPLSFRNWILTNVQCKLTVVSIRASRDILLVVSKFSSKIILWIKITKVAATQKSRIFC